MKYSVYVDFKTVQSLSYKKMWSLTKLASQADISLSTLFAIQRKKGKASMKTVLKLATALNVAPDELIEK